MNTRHAASPLHLFARGVGFCDKQIFKHRFVEKISALADHCHFFYKRSRVYFVYGNTVVVYLSAAAVPEAEHKFQKRTLSAPRSAHYTYGFTLSDIHVDAFEHLFAAVRERKVLYVRPFQCYILLPFHRLHGGLFFEKVKHPVAAGKRLVEVAGKRGYCRYGAERAEHRHNSDYRPANGQIARKHERDRHGKRYRYKEGYDQRGKRARTRGQPLYRARFLQKHVGAPVGFFPALFFASAQKHVAHALYAVHVKGVERGKFPPVLHAGTAELFGRKRGEQQRNHQIAYKRRKSDIPRGRKARE